MKKMVGAVLCAAIFTVGAAEAEKKKTVSFSDMNQTDEFFKYLGTDEHGDELPFAGNYTNVYGLRDLVDTLHAEYKEIIEEDYERHIALDYAKLKEEEILSAMSFADGLGQSLQAYLSLLNKKIAQYAQRSAEDYEQARLKDPKNALKLKNAWESRQRGAEILRQAFLDKVKRLEPFRTPRRLKGGAVL